MEHLKVSCELADAVCCGKEFHSGTTLGRYEPRCAWVRLAPPLTVKLFKEALWFS